ncbi:HNH endonuclease [Ruegeria jejuensis]|uniref:HNH endonuclease n=1 Tax=Ruegeria jejuensis TaxID=3233338 RepID=UPI00355AEA18
MPGWHSTSRHERGYGYEWVKRRDRILARDGYLCQPCLRKGRPTPAQEVDHIIPKAQDGTDDDKNLQSICTPCHKAKTKAENSTKQQIGEDGWPL